MTAPEPTDPRVASAVAAAVAAIEGRTLEAPDRAARRATAVIAAIAAHRPGA